MQLFDELKVVFIATITGVTIGLFCSYSAYQKSVYWCWYWP